MFRHIGTAIRFFLVGFGVGLLTAPRSGRATRHIIQRTGTEIFHGVTGGTSAEMSRSEMRIGQPYETVAYGLVPPMMEDFPAA